MEYNVHKRVRRIAISLLWGAAMFIGGANAQTLKIGVVGPFTGGGAPWGLAGAAAPRILAKEINAKGGLQVGGKRYKIEVIAYDDQYKTALAIAAYNRLVNQDGVKFMIVATSPATMALKQNIENDDVVALTAAYTGKAIDKHTRHLFRMYSAPEDYMGSFIGWMKDHVAGKRVVIVNPNDETGWDQTKLSERLFKQNGFEVLSHELFERAQKDFQPLLTRIIGMKPDIIELGGTPPATAGLIIRQARELGYDKLFSKTGGPAPHDIVASAGAKAAEGTINMLYADPANAGYQRIAAAYKQAHNQEPNEILVPFYDGVNVLLHAIQRAGTVDDTAKVAAAFSQVLPMRSVQGENLKLGGASNYGADAQIMTVNYIGVIRNGVPVVLGRTK